MVVDDDPAMRLVVRVVLEREGHDVLEAAHGKAALDLLQRDSLPDVVMTDLIMPVLDGLELIDRLRSEAPTAAIPIIVLSGSVDDLQKLADSGLVEAVVPKPYDPARLAQCVRLVAAKGRGSEATGSGPDKASAA